MALNYVKVGQYLAKLAALEESDKDYSTRMQRLKHMRAIRGLPIERAELHPSYTQLAQHYYPGVKDKAILKGLMGDIINSDVDFEDRGLILDWLGDQDVADLTKEQLNTLPPSRLFEVGVRRGAVLDALRAQHPWRSMFNKPKLNTPMLSPEQEAYIQAGLKHWPNRKLEKTNFLPETPWSVYGEDYV